MSNNTLVQMCAVALVCGGCSSKTEAPEDPAATGVPTFPEDLGDGWTEMLTGGDTVCSRGTEYAFFVNKGTVNKVIVDFIGGGACWNDFTCGVADAIFNPDIENVRGAIAANNPMGFYDQDNPDNPFKDWYHVVIPYCTGDIHWGNNTQTYGSEDTEVTIEHKGAVNTRAVLDWVYESFSAPEQVFVTGCSAGSYGSAMWAPHIAKHYTGESGDDAPIEGHETRVVQFGDSGAGIITQSFFEDSFPSWKAEGAFPNWIGSLDPDDVNLLELSLGDLYRGLSDHYPQHQFSQYNTSFDENQVFFFTAMGGSGADEWSDKMHNSIAYIHDGADDFSSFIAPGDQHCILGANNFYSVNVDGLLLTDWLSTMIDGERPDSQLCTTGCDGQTP